VIRLARFADRGGVDVRKELHRVVHEDAIEGRRVGLAQVSKERVLVDRLGDGAEPLDRGCGQVARGREGGRKGGREGGRKGGRRQRRPAADDDDDDDDDARTATTRRTTDLSRRT